MSILSQTSQDVKKKSKLRAQNVTKMKATGLEGPIMPKQLLWSVNVSSTEKLIWATIREHEGTNTKGFPGIIRIAALLSLHQKTVMSAIEALASKEWLSVEKKPGCENQYECWVVLENDDYEARVDHCRKTALLKKNCTTEEKLHQVVKKNCTRGGEEKLHPKEHSERTQYRTQVSENEFSENFDPEPFPETAVPIDPPCSAVPPTQLKKVSSAKKENGPMEVALEYFTIRGLPSDPTDKSVISSALRYLRDAKSLIASTGSKDTAIKAIRIFNADYLRDGGGYDWGLGPVIKKVPLYQSKGRLSTTETSMGYNDTEAKQPDNGILIGQAIGLEQLPNGWIIKNGRAFPIDRLKEWEDAVAVALRQNNYRLTPFDVFGSIGVTK